MDTTTQTPPRATAAGAWAPPPLPVRTRADAERRLAALGEEGSAILAFYAEPHPDAIRDAYEEGCAHGRADRQDEARAEGYDAGFADGEAHGRADRQDEARAEGYDAGFADGEAKGRKEGASRGA